MCTEYHSSCVEYGEIMFFPKNNSFRLPRFHLTILLLRQSSTKQTNMRIFLNLALLALATPFGSAIMVSL
jgi:hypothetical protein